MAADGPSSIVKAAADGKRVANAIALAFGEQRMMPVEEKRVIDLQDLVVRRARRQYRVPVSHTSLDQRSGFDETVLGYTPEEASAEAGRCLDCHDICSLCVGVCPNAALMTYEIDPVRYELADGTFVADQGPQIAVLSDFCNECGNCVTVCPTSGQPYVDKPRIYLNREEFEAEDDNAFMMFDDSSIEARVGGQTHRLSLNGSVEYSTPDGSAVLDNETLAPLSNSLGDASLRPAATMLTVMNGVSGSMPQVPLMPASEVTRTMVSHPGYEE